MHKDQIGMGRTKRTGGPRTPEGKERSKHNATKHGIFSKVLLLEGEPKAEFDSLLDGLRADYQPKGTLEEDLVDKLATHLWRHRRLISAERAEIQIKVERLEWDRENRKFDKREEIKSAKPLEPSPSQIGDLGKPMLRRMDLILNLRDTPKELWPSSLEVIEAEVEEFELYKQQRAAFEFSRAELEVHRLSVPDSEVLDRLLRYEASLERSFDRTLKQLERAQRMRLGLAVPPSVDVNI